MFMVCQNGVRTGQHEEVVQHPLMHLTGFEVIGDGQIKVSVLDHFIDQGQVRDQDNVINPVAVQDGFQFEQVLRREQQHFSTVQVDMADLIMLHDFQEPLFKQP